MRQKSQNWTIISKSYHQPTKPIIKSTPGLDGLPWKQAQLIHSIPIVVPQGLEDSSFFHLDYAFSFTLRVIPSLFYALEQGALV